MTAVEQSADLVRAWRVLIGQTDERGVLQPVSVSWTTLAHTQRPVVLVVRIEGQLAQWDEDALLNQISSLFLHAQSASLSVAGIEIDHDCGTAKLSKYARFLSLVRARLERQTALSITALPTWLSSSDFDTVLAQVDEVVLQVHAVQSPRLGLFHPDDALQWIVTLADRSSVPFRVALPTYGARVSWREDGSLLAVESETPLLAGGQSAAEWMAAPQEVTKLLRTLTQQPPAHFAGVVWFRLPTAEDRRTWSPETWRAVIEGRTLRDQVTVRFHPGDTPGLEHVMLVNTGAVDAALPQSISLPEHCPLADGVNGYELERSSTGLMLRRQQGGLLRSRHHQVIGWVRCPPE
jgi:hypothetical protein